MAVFMKVYRLTKTRERLPVIPLCAMLERLSQFLKLPMAVSTTSPRVDTAEKCFSHMPTGELKLVVAQKENVSHGLIFS